MEAWESNEGTSYTAVLLFTVQNISSPKSHMEGIYLPGMWRDNDISVPVRELQEASYGLLVIITATLIVD